MTARTGTEHQESGRRLLELGLERFRDPLAEHAQPRIGHGMGQVEDEQPGHLAPFQGVEDRLHRQPGRQVVGVRHHGQQVDLVVADQSQGRDVHEERRVMLLGQFIELGFQQPERLALASWCLVKFRLSRSLSCRENGTTGYSLALYWPILMVR